MSRKAAELHLLLLTLIIVFHLGSSWVEEGVNEEFYSLSVRDASGHDVPMSSYIGKVLLIVNVASECGYTHKHYQEMVQLQHDLEPLGLFQVLAFPCNQFGQQEPQAVSEIIKLVSSTFQVNFQLFDKVNVVGDDASSLWKYLKDETGRAPDWNFWKYVIDHKGNILGSWGPQTSVTELSSFIKKAVGAVRRHLNELPGFDDTETNHLNAFREL